MYIINQGLLQEQGGLIGMVWIWRINGRL